MLNYSLHVLMFYNAQYLAAEALLSVRYSGTEYSKMLEAQRCLYEALDAL